MTKLEKLEQHRKTLALRTMGSIAGYVCFFFASLTTATQQLVLEDPLTLITLALLIVSFLALPRDYVPRHFLVREDSEEEMLKVDELRRLERLGMYLRIVYVLGAVFTVWGLRQLMS